MIAARVEQPHHFALRLQLSVLLHLCDVSHRHQFAWLVIKQKGLLSHFKERTTVHTLATAGPCAQDVVLVGELRANEFFN